MQWTAEQYIRRVTVQTASATGRSITEIANESFALTLWTWSELQEMRHEESVQRMGERTDLAGQVAIAFHQPQDLQKMEMRYLKAAGQLSQMFENAKHRAAVLVEKMQTATVQTE